MNFRVFALILATIAIIYWIFGFKHDFLTALQIFIEQKINNLINPTVVNFTTKNTDKEKNFCTFEISAREVAAAKVQVKKHNAPLKKGNIIFLTEDMYSNLYELEKNKIYYIVEV